eukprot:jgi/Galph1/100/GphlegSOOS_G4780.1
MWLWLLILGFFFSLFWSLWKEILRIRQYRKQKSKRTWIEWSKKDFEKVKSGCRPLVKDRIRLMVILGSGGHTAELIEVLRSIGRVGLFEEKDSSSSDLSKSLLQIPPSQVEITYVAATSDKHSAIKAQRLHERDGMLSCFQCRMIFLPRAREVGQSYFSSLFTTLFSLMVACKKFLFSSYVPDVVLCNGPGTCVPVVIIIFIRNVIFSLPLKNKTSRIIFIESVARVRTLSLSGRLLYPFVHRFLVQWPDIRERYPLVEYTGMFL